MPRRERPRQRRLDEFPSVLGGPVPEPPVRRPVAAPLPGVWQVRDGFVVHPLVREATVRGLPFQIDFARIAIGEDLLVVLPTGLGKTVIAALVAAEVLRGGEGKLLFLAPTRPLVQQHVEAFASWVPGLRRAKFTGTVAHPKREGSWDATDAVFATPEIIQNDLAAGRYDLTSVRLLVLDEAHHTVGKYAYVAIAARFQEERRTGSRLLGLTASPGGREERVQEVVDLLGGLRIEARSRDDPGVREFVQGVDIDFRWVELPPEAKRVQALLEKASHEVARKLQRIGYLRKKPITSLSVKDLLALRAEIFARPGPMTRKFGPLFHQLVLLHLHHALERLETQGMEPFRQYVERVRTKAKPGRGDKAFVALPEVVQSVEEARVYLEGSTGVSHPKLDALVDVVEGSSPEGGTARPESSSSRSTGTPSRGSRTASWARGGPWAGSSAKRPGTRGTRG
ncbi:MAG TPA: DEAD/DEAH box helicase [Thermoplasmata archaeon]